MNLVNSIKAFYTQKGKKAAAPEGFCPNCWGSQEYAGVIRDLEKDIQIEIGAGNANYAFIQDFVVNHVNGIKLRNKLDGLTCDKCKMTHPSVK